eukprot:COSAG01_NODE_28382_length_662_cov_1.262877_1_plen_220_part_11
MLGQADSTSTSQVAAAGTLLLWLRVIQYLNGFTATAAYVRMTLSVVTDMKIFMLIMAILVAGNACVLVLLYPLPLDAFVTLTKGTNTPSEYESSHWAVSADDKPTLQGKFGNLGSVLFSATLMLFTGWDTDQLNMALSPTLATGHYIFYVILVPLVMLNLLVRCTTLNSLHLADSFILAYICCTTDCADGWVLREGAERAQECNAASACRAAAAPRGVDE